jgi:hypothetical protein
VKLFIPWRLFFRLLSKQPRKKRGQWLTLFKFDDCGVELIPDVPVSAVLSFRKKQERAAVSAVAERKRVRILH